MATYARYPLTDASAGNAQLNPTVATQAAVTLYVNSATGADTNPGTLAAPLATIQAAVNLVPKLVRNAVTINVAAGTYAGAQISGFNFSAGAGGYLAIVGTMVASTITGLQTGTIASGTAGSLTSGTWATATVTGAGWTVDALRGKIVRIDSGTGSGQYRVISSNTATVLTVPGAWTTPTGATFSIVEPGTVVSTGVTRPAGYDTSSSAGFAGFYIVDNVGGANTAAVGSVFLDSLSITCVRMVYVSSREVVLVRRSSMVAGANTTAVAANGSGGEVRTEDCFCSTFTGGTFMSGSGNTFVQATRNVVTMVTGSGACYSFTQGPVRIITRSNSVVGGVMSMTLDTGCTVDGQGDKYDAVTPGSTACFVSSNTTTDSVSVPASLSLSGVAINNYGTGIRLTGAGVSRLFGVVSGTGNTTGIEVTKGARLQIATGVTLTGTTEIQIDAATTTLATMRAASPKLVKDANYLTTVYE